MANNYFKSIGKIGFNSFANENKQENHQSLVPPGVNSASRFPGELMVSKRFATL